MARTRNNMEELGSRVDKVEDLRDEQKQQGLAEMAENCNDHKDHAGKVAVCVADEYTRRIPIVREECKRHPEEREQEIQREQMGVCRWMHWLRIRN